jgi:hypothetical protein
VLPGAATAWARSWLLERAQYAWTRPTSCYPAATAPGGLSLSLCHRRRGAAATTGRTRTRRHIPGVPGDLGARRGLGARWGRAAMALCRPPGPRGDSKTSDHVACVYGFRKVPPC